MNWAVEDPSPKDQDNARQGLCLPTCGRITCRPTHSLKPRKVQRRLKSLGLSYDDIPSSCAHVSEKCD